MKFEEEIYKSQQDQINHLNSMIYGVGNIEKGNKTYFSEKEREKLSKKGEAMPDGSFPIRNSQDLKDAVKQYGRAKDPEKVKRWIIKRAKELGLKDSLPEKWEVK